MDSRSSDDEDNEEPVDFKEKEKQFQEVVDGYFNELCALAD